MLRRVGVLVAVAILCSFTLPVAAVSVELICNDCPTTGIEVSLVAEPAARSADDDQDRIAERRFLTKVPGTIELDVGPGSWTLRVEGDDVWAAPVEVVIGGDETPASATVPVHRAGWVRAPAAPHASVADPEGFDARLSFQSPAATPRERRLAGATACRVGQRELQCKLPVGVHDLSLEADGFAPIRRFDVVIAAGARVRLERVRWIRGASVHGWVLGPDGSPVAGAEVAVAPFTGTGSASPEAVHRSRRGTVEAMSDARGFFQATGLAPGWYRVEAKADSFARLRLADPIDVTADNALELELELAAPMSWTVHVTPTLGPGFEPWGVSLRPLDEPPGEASPNVLGTASPSGSWTWDEAEPGRYGLDIMAANGDSFHSEIVTIDYRDAVLAVEVVTVAVRGTVHRGDEPVSGRLRLAATEGHEHARFAIDEEGRFEGVLPKAGKWWPEVEIGGETEFSLVLDAVEVEAADPSEPAVLVLEIPDTRLSGRVVDRDGVPVAEAAITVGNESHLSGQPGRHVPAGMLRSAADGTFSVRGLAPGPLTLSARHGSAVSAEHYVTLVESETGAPLRLVLEEKVVWTGLVQSGGQPIAGARVAMWSDPTFRGGGHSTRISVSETVSRDDGVFEVTLPANVESAVVLAGAPGLATQLFRASSLQRQQLIISLAPGGGRLHIRGGGPRTLAGLWLEHRGIVVPSIALLLGRLVPGFDPRSPVATLTNLASGEYALCQRSPETGAPTCERAFLPPGGEVTLGGPDNTVDGDDADGADDRDPASDRIVSDERSPNE